MLGDHIKSLTSGKPHCIEGGRGCGKTAFAEALAEGCVVTSLRAASETIRHEPVQSVADLLAGVERAGLMPPGLSIAENRTTVVSATGTFHVRYRPNPLGVEIISIPLDHLSGQALLVRVPEDDEPENGAAFRYFAATRHVVLF